MITSYPGKPIKSASVVASSPALPEEIESNSQLNNNSSRSPSPRFLAKKKRIVRNNKDKGRIRKVHKNKWKDVERKNNENSGKEYQSRNGVRSEKKKKWVLPVRIHVNLNAVLSSARIQDKNYLKNFGN